MGAFLYQILKHKALINKMCYYQMIRPFTSGGVSGDHRRCRTLEKHQVEDEHEKFIRAIFFCFFLNHSLCYIINISVLKFTFNYHEMNSGY